MRQLLCLLLTFVMFYAGCAGREAHPVPSYIPGDEKKSCLVLKAEMAQIEAEIANKLPKSDKGLGNVLLGAAGCFVIVPWFFMDLKGAEKIEVEAMQRRYNALSIFAADKGCVVPSTAEYTPMACSVCGVAKPDMVIIDNMAVCPECHKKQKSSEEKTK